MTHDCRFKKVLIANRGEIARRIKRACDALGLQSALAVSDPDLSSLAAREAVELAPLGGSTARESYLNGQKVIDAALKAGCDAVHPGYGFLSENAEFAEMVRSAGLVFVGPSPESIRALGNKPNARKTVQAVGVPTTPGSEGLSTEQELVAAAERIGYPIIIKAAAGGGGRGMRIVRSSSQMREALEQASAEAAKNFGSADVYFEKFIEEPRHVEVQLFGDQHGKVVHFGTRDCSAQRRHQKLVEEAPAPFLDPDTRERIHQAAVSAAKSVGYYNAGTAEFLVKGKEFYFLEINTRIQVEHPVTEAITGVDLVQLQLKVAMGEPIPFEQQEIQFCGHAIELRINAEDTSQGFRPATGPIGAWKRKATPLVREDYGYEAHDTVPPYYDSLMSKIIVSGATRAEALSRVYRYLREYDIQGIPTSLPFHVWILSRPEFQGEGIDIGFVERTFTAEEAAEALEMHRLDPAHRGSGAQSEATSERVYIAEACGGYRSVDLVHETGGTFLAIPLTVSGTPARREFWRRSSTRAGALEAVASSD